MTQTNNNFPLQNHITKFALFYIGGLVKDCGNSIADALGLA